MKKAAFRAFEWVEHIAERAGLVLAEDRAIAREQSVPSL